MRSCKKSYPSGLVSVPSNFLLYLPCPGPLVPSNPIGFSFWAGVKPSLSLTPRERREARPKLVTGKTPPPPAMPLHPAVLLLLCAWMEGAKRVTRECLAVLTLLAECCCSQEVVRL